MNKNSLAIVLTGLIILLIVAACESRSPTSSIPTSQVTLTHPTSIPTDQSPTTIPSKTQEPELNPQPETDPLIIAPENVGQISQLLELGKGGILSAPIWSQDGKWIAIPTAAGVYIYNAETLEEQIRIPAASIFNAFLPDGTLLTSNEKGLVAFWDPASGAKTSELTVDLLGDPETSNLPISISRDGNLLATSSDTQISAWSLASGEKLHDFSGNTLEFSPAGELAVVISYDENQVHLYETSTGSEENQWSAQLAGFSPGGQLWLEDEGMVRLVDIKRDLVTAPFQGTQGTRPSFSADGSIMALFANGQVSLFDPQNGRRLQVLEGNYIRTEGVLFSPDGQTLAGDMYTTHCPTCSEQDGLDRFLVIWRATDGSIITKMERQEQAGWITYSSDGSQVAAVQTENVLMVDAADGSVIKRLEGFTAQIEGMAVSPDGSTVATVNATEPYILRLWDLESGQVLQSLQNKPEGGLLSHIELAFSPDGGILAVGSDLWDLTAGERMTGIEQKISDKTSCWSSDVAFAPNEYVLATGCFDGQLDLWSMPEGQHLQSISGYNSWVEGLAYSPEGDKLAAIYGVPDYLVQVWQLPEGRPAYNLEGGHFSRVVYSPDGQILATVRAAQEYDEYGLPAGFVEVWSAADGELIKQLDVGDAVSIAFSPDGKLIATGSLDGILRLWQVEGGKLLMEANVHYASVERVAFTPDGTRLVTGSYDGTITIWGMGDSSLP